MKLPPRLIPGEAGGTESERVMFKSSIVEAAAKSCGQKDVGSCHGGNLRIHWWTPEVKGAVVLKKEAFGAWLAQGSPEAVGRETEKAAAWQSPKLKSGI